MTYTVVWRPAAKAQLVRLWTTAVDREAVADAMDDANRLLRDRPFDLGESRDQAAHRVWFQRPLLILALIDDTAGVVYVGGVRWVGG